MKKQLIAFLFLSSFAFWQYAAAAPIPYSGKVAINGLNFQGDAQFTFALRDADGTVHWRNGVDANASINVPVDRGIYVVLLGGQGMNALSSNLFLDHPELYLQVRFYRADTQEWLHLAPDQRITSAPHPSPPKWRIWRTSPKPFSPEPSQKACSPQTSSPTSTPP